MKATCYHLRNMSGQQVLGGIINAPTLDAAAEKLVKELDIATTNSGSIRCQHNGQDVWVYLSVDPAETEKGQHAKTRHRIEREAAELKKRMEQDYLELEFNRVVAEHGGMAAVIKTLKGQ